jgi:hypothetical protein
MISCKVTDNKMISFEMLSLFVYTGHWVIGIPFRLEYQGFTTNQLVQVLLTKPYPEMAQGIKLFITALTWI